MEEKQLSKKERKALKKQEQEEARVRAATEKRAQTRRTWTVVIISTVVILAFLTWLIQNRPEQQSLFDDTPDTINPVTAEDHTKGASAENAKLTLIEYSDLECPACGAYYPVVKQVVEDHKADIQFVYRHLPIQRLHPNAVLAAHFAEAAGKQGQFFAMHDLLFENQSAWAGTSAKEARATFLSYAERLGLDVAQLETDADSPEAAAKVEAERIDAVGAGASATPTFFIDGEKIENPPNLEAFDALITSLLQNTNASDTSSENLELDILPQDDASVSE